MCIVIQPLRSLSTNVNTIIIGIQCSPPNSNVWGAQTEFDFFLQARVARLQVLRLFWCPRDLCLYYIYIYICLSALEDYHAVYTRCIGRMHSLATTSGPARKVGVVSIFKMAGLDQTLLNLSSSKIR